MPITPEDEAMYTEYFEKLDKNGDCNFSIPEMISLIRALGWTKEMFSNGQIFDMFMEMDTDENHKVDKTEFLTVMGKRPKAEFCEANLRRMMTDKSDENGFVADSEILECLGKTQLDMTEDKILAMIKQAGTDGSGRADMDKFMALLNFSSLLK